MTGAETPDSSPETAIDADADADEAPELAGPPDAPPRRTAGGCLWRLFTRSVLVLLLTLVGLFALVAGWLYSTDFQSRIVPVVEDLLASQTGEDVSIDAVRVRLWAPAILGEGLTITSRDTGDDIVSAAFLRIPLVLRDGGPAIGRMVIDKPRVHLHLNEEGKLLEFSRMKRKPPEERKPLKRLPWWSIDITDGAFRLTHPQGAVEIDAIELHPDRSGYGQLEARLRGQVRGLSVRTELQWPDVRIGPDTIEVPELRVRTPPLDLDGRVRIPFQGEMDVALTALSRLDRIEPVLTPPRKAHGLVHLDLSASGTLQDPELVALAFADDLGLDMPGVFTPLLTYELKDITASVRADRDGVVIEEAVLHWGGGKIVAEAKITPDKRIHDIHITGDGVHLKDLLQAFDAAPTPWIDMTSDLEIRAQGTLQPVQIEGDFELAVADLFVGDRPIGRKGIEAMLDIPWANVTGNILFEKNHVLLTSDDVRGPRSRGSTRVDIGFGPRGPLDLSFQLDEGNLLDFQPLRGVELTGRGQVSARVWGPFNRLQLLGTGDLSGFSVLGIPYADRLVATIRSPELKTLHLDDAEAWIGDSHYSGRYSMDFRPPLSMSTAIEIDEGRVEDMVNMFVDLDGLTGDLEGTLTLDGPINDMTGEAHLVLRDAGVWGEQFPTGEAHGYLDEGVFTLDELRVRRDEGTGITLRGEVGRGWALDMELVADGVELERMDRLKDYELPLLGRATAWSHIEGTLFEPEPLGRIAVTDVRYAGAVVPDSVLSFFTDEGVAHYEGDLIGGHAFTSGTLGLWDQQPYDLTIDLDQLPAHLFYPTAADGQPLTAVATGRLDLSGHFGAEWSPVALGGRLDRVAVAWDRHRLVNTQPWDISVDGPRFDLQGINLEGGATRFNLSASGGEALLVGGDGVLDLDLLRAAVPSVERATGTADVVLYAVGAKPNVQARVDIDVDAELFRLADVPLTFEDTQVTLSVTEDAIVVERIDGSVGGGTLTGRGRIEAEEWQPTRYDITVEARDALVQWVDSLPPAIGDADLAFDGPSEALLLSGDVEVEEMVFVDRIDWEDWVVSYREEMLVDPASMSNEEAMFNLNVHINAPGTIQLRNNIGEGFARADLRLLGDTVRPGLVGKVEIFDTIAFLQDREFRVDRGTLLFNDPWTWDPEIDFSLLTNITNQTQRYDIGVQVQGPFSNWRTSTRSDPALPQNDVNALLWFGMTMDQLEQMGELSSAVFQGVADLMLTDFFVSGQAGELSSAPELLFDRIDITTGVTARGEYSPDPRLVVEKRLDDLGDVDLSWQINLVRPEDTYVSANYRIGGIWSLSGWYATLQRDRVLPIGGAYGVDVTARWEVE